MKITLQAAGNVFSIIGAISSAIIAIAAIFIQIQLENSNVKSKKVDRSIALFQEFNRHDAVGRLLNNVFFLEHSTNNEFNRIASNRDDMNHGEIYNVFAKIHVEEMIKAISNYNKPETSNGAISFAKDVSEFLGQLEIVAECAGITNVQSIDGIIKIYEESEDALCDLETLMIFFRSYIMNFHFTMRAWIYCSQSYVSSQLVNYEKLVKVALMHDGVDINRIVHSREEVDPIWLSDGQSYIVIGYPSHDRNCETLMGELLSPQ